MIIRADNEVRIFVRWPHNPDGPFVLVGITDTEDDDQPTILAELDEDAWRELKHALIRRGKTGRRDKQPDFICRKGGV